MFVKRFNIFIDETGNFGFEKDNSKLYGVSFTFHDSEDNIKNNIDYLNQKLKNIGYDDMIHMADLVSRRGDYKNFDIQKRRQIFWAIFMFTKKADIRIHSIIINKNRLVDKYALKEELTVEIIEFINEYRNFIERYDKVIVYYDGGQEELKEIIELVVVSFTNCVMRKKFNHKEKRLFQVSDMLTFVDKLNYKRKNKLEINKNEKSFFENKYFKKIIDELKLKRM